MTSLTERPVSQLAVSSWRQNWRRWIGVVIVLPAIIAAIDYSLPLHLVSSTRNLPAVAVTFAWYVVQIGAVGYIVGRASMRPWLRWMVFAWILLLVNLLTMTTALVARDADGHLPPAALFAGQVGFCVVWAFMGDTRWTVRWPLAVLVAGGLLFLWVLYGHNYGHRVWSELLFLYVLTLSCLCGLLRWRRFHLTALEPHELAAGNNSQRNSMQFGLKHVMVWTTSLAILLGAARALDLFDWETAKSLVQSGLVWKLTVAVTTAIVLILALWVALGRGLWILRYSVALLMTGAFGSGLALLARHNLATIPTGGWTWRWWELHQWFQIGWWWLGWLFLSGGLLASTLIILRVLNYRLVRAPRRAGVASGIAS